MPIYAWVLLLIAAVIAVAVLRVRSLYVRFRGMCRGVREELTRWVSQRYPRASVLGEQQGNLVVRLADGSERVWEMADVYTAVARLPGMGVDPAGRARVYEEAARGFFPPEDLSGPLSLAAHGSRIKPRLVRPEDLGGLAGGGVLHTPVPDLELETVYALGVPPGDRILTEQDTADLGLDRVGLHAAAMENLRRDFPRKMVEGASKEGGGGTAVQFGDGFDAARLLLVPECLQAGQELVALAPHRDMLVLLGGEVRDDPDKLREGLRLLECEGHPPLLARAVRVMQDGFQLL